MNFYPNLLNGSSVVSVLLLQPACTSTDAVYVCGGKGENHSHFTKALAMKMDSCGF